VIWDDVRRIKRVQFFAKKGDRRTFLRGTQGSHVPRRLTLLVFDTADMVDSSCFRKGIEKAIRVKFLKGFVRRFSIKCKNK